MGAQTSPGVATSAMTTRRRNDRNRAPKTLQVKRSGAPDKLASSDTPPNRESTQVATDDTEFTQVFRGYDKEEVEQAIEDLRNELASARTQHSDAEREIARLNSRIEELDSELEEVDRKSVV